VHRGNGANCRTPRNLMGAPAAPHRRPHPRRGILKGSIDCTARVASRPTSSVSCIATTGSPQTRASSTARA